MSFDAPEGTTGDRLERSQDRLADAFYPVFDLLFDEDSVFVSNLEDKLGEAMMARTAELYLSRAIGVGFLAGLFLWVGGTALGYGLFATGFVQVDTITGITVRNDTVVWLLETLRVPFLIGVTGVVFGLIGFVGAVGPLLGVPYVRASKRRREINMLLPDAVSFMYALSIGGLNQLELLEEMARGDDIYGEVAREFQVIVQETEYFDTDYRTAIRNQALQTPSEELSQFLVDMMSIIDSGGDVTEFLEDKKQKHMRTAKREQEQILDMLELMGEMYIALSLFPLLLVIVLVVMSMLGQSQKILLFVTVYVITPGISLLFLVMVSTIKQDEYGSGRIELEADSDWLTADRGSGSLAADVAETVEGDYYVFDRIRLRERIDRALGMVKRPHVFFRDNPSYTLLFTVPVALLSIPAAIVLGLLPVTWDGIVARPVASTFGYVYYPAFLVGIPLAGFREWNVRSRRAVLRTLSDDLLKLATVNDTGMTVLEAIGTVAETSNSKLAEEFAAVYRKVNYGLSLKESLVEFNNDYRIPRLARTVKLVAKAQEASSRLTAVLSTAAQASENQDEIERERKSRSRMQVVIIVMSFLTVLGVMGILKTQFLDVMARLTQQANGAQGGTPFGAAIDLNLMSLLFFHAVTIQGMLAGFISGYLREANLVAGVKYVVALLAVSLAFWAVVV